MGEFATVILGLGLITMGAALITATITGYQLPAGITEIAVTVIAIAGRALLASRQGDAGTQDHPGDVTAQAPDPLPNGTATDAQDAADLRGSPAD
jgi:hypothetical protein|tara:strand:+ start:536 stop:820 length:285 start_codon:yes stop_codon:yes gene_type:complete